MTLKDMKNIELRRVNKMTLKDMKNIQAAADMLQTIIGNALECKPYEVPDYIQDAYYSANTLWLTLQKMIEKEEAR